MTNAKSVFDFAKLLLKIICQKTSYNKNKILSLSNMDFKPQTADRMVVTRELCLSCLLGATTELFPTQII